MQRSLRTSRSTFKRKPIIIYFAALAIFLSRPANLLAGGDEPADPDSSEVIGGWRFLGAPYMEVDSDDGLVLGLGAGVSLPPRYYILNWIESSFRGFFRIGLEGEVETGGLRHVGKISFDRMYRYLYSEEGADPEAFAKALVEHSEIKLSALRPSAWGSNRWFEIGPSIHIEHAKGIDPTDTEGVRLPIESLDRFRPGTLVLAGIHARYRTTGPVRPLDGVVLSVILQAGGVEWNGWEKPRTEATAVLHGAWAVPAGDHLRIYLRGEGRLQLESPPPLRDYIGGGERVRGIPDRREFGRRVLLGRAQLHLTAIRGMRWPMELASAIIPPIPVWPMEVEVVPFYDVGAVGDPDFGWLKTRHGFGGGLRFVLPPDLVVHLDIAQSPGGETKFYFGFRETL